MTTTVSDEKLARIKSALDRNLDNITAITSHEVGGITIFTGELVGKRKKVAVVFVVNDVKDFDGSPVKEVVLTSYEAEPSSYVSSGETRYRMKAHHASLSGQAYVSAALIDYVIYYLD